VCSVEQIEMLIRVGIKVVHSCKNVLLDNVPTRFVEDPNEPIRAWCLV